MKTEPYISIVLVCYNYAHLLPRALEGIASQTFRDFELVFVNNGSTDNSLQLFEEFIAKHPDIAYQICDIKTNIGVAHGDNTGAYAAKGEYLLFHDADDWMDPDTLQKITDAAYSCDADRVISAFRDVDDNGQILQVQELAEDPIYWFYGMQQANLFKRSIYIQNQIQVSDSLWIDAEKTLKFSQYVKTAAYVDEPCYNYLVHTDSTSRNSELYKHIWTIPRYSFNDFLNTCMGVFNSCSDTNIQSMVEYQICRYYYSYIYQFLRDAPYKEKCKNYVRIHEIMASTLPDYLHNSYIWGNNNHVRKYAIWIVRISSLLERTHTMKLGLLGYHLLSKIMYFQV